MKDTVVLDSTPLGILCHPRNPPHVMACRQWVESLLLAGRRVVVPEIADYEVRRELIRINSLGPSPIWISYRPNWNTCH